MATPRSTAIKWIETAKNLHNCGARVPLSCFPGNILEKLNQPQSHKDTKKVFMKKPGKQPFRNLGALMSLWWAPLFRILLGN
jgi:hypothetical protein